MGTRTISFEGKQYQFPSDATDDEISQTLASAHDQGPPNSGLSGVSRPRNPIIEASHDPRSPYYQDSPFHESTSIENLGGYVDTGPIEMGRGVNDILHGNIARGGHKVISGGMTTAAPAMLPLAPISPLHTAGALGGGYAGGKLMHAMAEESGLNPEQSEFAGDIGNVVGGYGGAKGTSPTMRGTGQILTKIGNLPDAPTNEVMPRTMNLGAKVLNAGKSVAGRVGKPMSRYGIPQAPNVARGEPTYQEPDLPKIRPDESSHYNDVQDQGETNRLMDAIHGHDFIKPSDRPSVQPSGQPNYDDVTLAEPPRDPYVDTLMPDDRPLSQRISDEQNKGRIPTADETPTPMSDTLLRAIKSAPGWPENGLPNKPWDMIHAEDELPHALDTDPYNRPTDQAVQTEGYTGPERRGSLRSDMANWYRDRLSNPELVDKAKPLPGVDPNDEIAVPTGGARTYGFSNRGYDTPEEAQTAVDYLQSQQGFPNPRIRSFGDYHSVEWGEDPSAKDNMTQGYYLGYKNPAHNPEDFTGSINRGLALPPASETVGSQSGADADTAAFNQARQELPNGSLSDHLRRAQEIKEGR